MRKLLIILSVLLAVFSTGLIAETLVENMEYGKIADKRASEAPREEEKSPSDSGEQITDNNREKESESSSGNKVSENSSGALSSEVAFAMERGKDEASIVVLGVPERDFVEIKTAPKSSSRTLGRVYGSTVEVKVLGGEGSYAFIEGRDYDTHKVVKGYIPANKLKVLEVNKEYKITVDLSEQTTYVYSGNKLIREIPVSTGIEGYDTIKGRFILGTRDKSFYTERFKEGAYNWVRFNRAYLFHSIPFDEKGRLKIEEDSKLGERASHGCIRMSMEDSKWFYDTMPEGTEVIVQE